MDFPTWAWTNYAQYLVVNVASRLEHCRKWRFEVRLDSLSNLWVEIFTPQSGTLHIPYLSLKDLDPGTVVSDLQPVWGYPFTLVGENAPTIERNFGGPTLA